jgi:hypothetical protein
MLTFLANLHLMQIGKENTTMDSIDISRLVPGAVLRVSHGAYDHLGLVGDQWIGGERAVLSLSATHGGLVEEPFSTFEGGRRVTLEGYPGSLPPEEVIRRARALGAFRYSWTHFNCEHFVCRAHGVNEESPQLRQWLFAAGLAAMMLTVLRAG